MEISTEFLSTSLTTEIINFGNRRNRFPFCYQLDWIKVRFSNCKAFTKARALKFVWRNIVIHWQQYENLFLYGYLNPLQQQFCYILTVSFIGGGERSTCINNLSQATVQELEIYQYIQNIVQNMGEYTMKIKTHRYLILCTRRISDKRLESQISKKTTGTKQDIQNKLRSDMAEVLRMQ